MSGTRPVTMLSADLAGQTVLDVGCGTGASAREAARRGADRVVAVDIDDGYLEEARNYRAPASAAIEYCRADLEVALPSGTFDHVICHNLLHRVRNPIDVLDRLIACSSSSLVLEVTGIEAERPARLLRRDYGATPRLQDSLGQMPLALVGRDGTPGRKREQKFFFSPEAVRNLLMEQRRHFARLDTKPSDVDGRFLVVAHRRQVDHLVIVSGPTGAGKTTFLERLQAGDPGPPGPAGSAGSAGPVDQWLGTDVAGLDGYEVTNSDGLRTLSGDSRRLLFHYDLLRPWRRDAAVHQRDEGLHVVDCARRLDVVVLVASAAALRTRLAEELDALADPDSRQGRRLRQVVGLYADPRSLIDRIEAWLGFCRSKGATPRFIDTSDGYRSIAESEWEATIRRTSVP